MSLFHCYSTAAHEDIACSFFAVKLCVNGGILERAGIRHIRIPMTLSTEYIRIEQAAKEMKI